MKKFLALAAVLVLGFSAFAGIKLYPGITFAGAAVPYISVETTIADTGSVKFMGSGADYIVSFRVWPNGRTTFPAEVADDVSSLPVFWGMGVAMAVDGDLFESAYYAEAGVILYNLLEVGFSARNGGDYHRLSINLGLSFALEF